MQQVARQTRAQTLPGSKSHSIVLDRIGIQQTQQAALLEMDVTRARRRIRLANRGGQSAMSFIAWLIATVARTLRDNPSACPPVSRRRADPGSVTVSLLVDRMVGEHRVTVPLVIRDAETRSVADIDAMITRVRGVAMDEATFVTGRQGGPAATIFRHLPGFIRRPAVRAKIRSRRRLERVHSNVVMTISGMGGRVKGWFIPTGRHPVCIGIGAVTPKAVVLNGTIEQREVFHMTLLVDQGALRGGPGSPWISQLVRSVESARELPTG